MAFDASPSWSGFNYQGKVALFYALKIINEKPLGEGFSNLSLMLENIEDFEIIEAGIVKTVHQVKAYNTSSYSKYEDALLEIVIELYNNNKTHGFIHTWKMIRFGERADLKSALKSDLYELLQQYQIVPRTGKSIIEKAILQIDNRPKKSAILRTGLAGKSADEIKDIIEAIYNEKNDALDRLKCYEYENGDSFCGLEEINNKIKAEIKAFSIRNKLATSENQIDRTFLYFFRNDRPVYHKQTSKQAKYKQNINRL